MWPAHRLTSLGVSKTYAKGRYADGNGLYLRVSPSLSKSWRFRSVRSGHATEIGIGPYPVISLSEARAKAFECNRIVHAGLNLEVEHRKRKAGAKSFGEVADEFLEAMQARWRGHLANILPPRRKLTRGHHPAMPYADVPAFIVDLRNIGTMAAKGLEFAILTACRSGEVRMARWEEIDFDNRLWVIPAARMKAKREHRVPLTDSTIELLTALKANQVSAYVFPGQKSGRPLSNMAFDALMRRMKVADASPHGFGSSFRDW